MTDKDAPKLSEVLEMMSMIWALDHGLHIASKRMETLTGLTGPQRLVLRIVAANRGIFAGALADVLHLHPSTLTGIVQRLEKRKLLQRVPDRDDARRVRLVATAAGQRLAKPGAPNTVESTLGSALDGLPATKVKAAREVLETFAAALRNFAGREGADAGPEPRKPRRRPARKR